MHHAGHPLPTARCCGSRMTPMISCSAPGGVSGLWATPRHMCTLVRLNRWQPSRMWLFPCRFDYRIRPHRYQEPTWKYSLFAWKSCPRLAIQTIDYSIATMHGLRLWDTEFGRSMMEFPLGSPPAERTKIPVGEGSDRIVSHGLCGRRRARIRRKRYYYACKSYN